MPLEYVRKCQDVGNQSVDQDLSKHNDKMCGDGTGIVNAAMGRKLKVLVAIPDRGCLTQDKDKHEDGDRDSDNDKEGGADRDTNTANKKQNTKMRRRDLRNSVQPGSQTSASTTLKVCHKNTTTVTRVKMTV